MFPLKALGVSCLVLVLALAGGSVLADERVERTLTLEDSIVAGSRLQLWNLLGSVTVTPGKAGTPLLVEARVVVEADSEEQAESLADSFELQRRDDGSDAGIQVRYPVDRYAAFRLPRSEKDGLLSKWVTPLVRKQTVGLVYDERMVEVGGGKGAAAVTVYVDVTLPLDVDLSVRSTSARSVAPGCAATSTWRSCRVRPWPSRSTAPRARTGGGEIQVWRSTARAWTSRPDPAQSS